MKSLKTYLFLLLLLPSLCSTAQSKIWKIDDVIQLKNGNTYTGKIIQIIPDSLYKVEIIGGSVIAIKAAEVKTIYREKSMTPKMQYLCDTTDGTYTLYTPVSSFYRYRPKGYFVQAHLYTGIEFGFDVVNGYKFGRLGFLGAGVGVHAYFFPLPLRENAGKSSGSYLPIYVYYGGDMIRNRITPYYSVSAGYAFGLKAFYQYHYSGNYGSSTKLLGGATGSIGIGAKFYGGHVYHTLGAHLTLQQVSYTRDNYYPDANNVVMHTYSSGSGLMIVPSFDIGICF